MAEAIVTSLLSNGFNSKSIKVNDPDAQRREVFENLDIATFTDNLTSTTNTDFVLLCTKPNEFINVAREVQGQFSKECTIISIMAGISTIRIASQLGHSKVVRVMPNLPAQIGKGTSVWFATDSVDKSSTTYVKNMLKTFGSEFEVKNEALIDVATAISGSGPAYVFLFMESMQDVGVELGFTVKQARDIAVNTVLGASEFASQNSNIHLAQLKNAVTSAGGTTAAALSAMEESGFRASVIKGIKKAFARSIELGVKK